MQHRKPSARATTRDRKSGGSRPGRRPPAQFRAGQLRALQGGGSCRVRGGSGAPPDPLAFHHPGTPAAARPPPRSPQRTGSPSVTQASGVRLLPRPASAGRSLNAASPRGPLGGRLRSRGLGDVSLVVGSPAGHCTGGGGRCWGRGDSERGESGPRRWIRSLVRAVWPHARHLTSESLDFLFCQWSDDIYDYSAAKSDWLRFLHAVPGTQKASEEQKPLLLLVRRSSLGEQVGFFERAVLERDFHNLPYSSKRDN